jgi:MFS family permease
MGKIADLWSAKAVFLLGLVWVGAFSIGIAVAQDKVVLFVLRAFAGLGQVSSPNRAVNSHEQC